MVCMCCRTSVVPRNAALKGQTYQILDFSLVNGKSVTVFHFFPS
jgi:hypothetical protein